jgi:hypothetical protein
MKQDDLGALLGEVLIPSDERLFRMLRGIGVPVSPIIEVARSLGVSPAEVQRRERMITVLIKHHLKRRASAGELAPGKLAAKANKPLTKRRKSHNDKRSIAKEMEKNRSSCTAHRTPPGLDELEKRLR